MTYGAKNNILATAGNLTTYNVTWTGGVGMFESSGTFTNSQLQFLGPNSVWLNVPGAVLTAPGAVSFSLHRVQIRVVPTGSDTTYYASANAVPVGM